MAARPSVRRAESSSAKAVGCRKRCRHTRSGVRRWSQRSKKRAIIHEVGDRGRGATGPVVAGGDEGGWRPAFLRSGRTTARPRHLSSSGCCAHRIAVSCIRSSKPCLAADRVEVAGRESAFERSVEPATALRIRCHLLRALACARSHSALSRLCFSLPATDTSAPAPLVGPAPSASGVPFMLLCGAMHSLRLAENTLRGLCEQPRPAERTALCHHTERTSRARGPA